MQSATPHTSMGYSTYYLLFRINPKLPVDLVFPSSEDTVANSDEWLVQCQNRLREAHTRHSRSWKQHSSSSS